MMKGDATQAAFFVFLILAAFLFVANAPLSDGVKRYALILNSVMLIFVPLAVLRHSR